MTNTVTQTQSASHKAKPETLNVYLWRSRQRGFLIVLASDLESARAAAVADHPNLQNFIIREPEAVAPAEAGRVVFLKQRL